MPINNDPNSYTKKDPYTKRIGNSTIDATGFDALIADNGIRFIHEKVAICPNMVGKLDTGVHDVNCSYCDNLLVHFDPVEIWAVLQRTKLNRMFEAQGTWDIGSGIIIVPSKKEDGDPFDINYFDRFTAVDFNVRFPELFQHSGTDIDVLKYKVHEVAFIRSARKQFFPNEDFRLTEDGHIKWMTNNRPNYDRINKIGEILTVVYYTPLVLRVLDMVHEHRYASSGVRNRHKIPVVLPQAAVVKRDFLIEPRDIANRLIHPEIIAQNNHPRTTESPVLDYIAPEQSISD